MAPGPRNALALPPPISPASREPPAKRRHLATAPALDSRDRRIILNGTRRAGTPITVAQWRPIVNPTRLVFTYIGFLFVSIILRVVVISLLIRTRVSAYTALAVVKTKTADWRTDAHVTHRPTKLVLNDFHDVQRTRVIAINRFRNICSVR